jgi:hypothetical protein
MNQLLGTRLFVLADSDNGYVHRLIPYYGKLTGDMCNFPYPEKLFASRKALALMDRVSGVEDYHLFVNSEVIHPTKLRICLLILFL